MTILKLYKSLFLFLLGMNIVVGQTSLPLEINEIDNHLTLYSQYNVTHHDNIDDEPHTHKHKHSEEGEEHEHNHEHSKVSQSETKLLNHSVKILAELTIIESKQGNTEKNLTSNSHPSRIYRPPIEV